MVHGSWLGANSEDLRVWLLEIQAMSAIVLFCALQNQFGPKIREQVSIWGWANGRWANS